MEKSKNPRKYTILFIIFLAFGICMSLISLDHALNLWLGGMLVGVNTMALFRDWLEEKHGRK